MAKVALVTGGSRGIGEAISKGLKAAGYSVAASYAGNDEAAAKFTAETGIKTYKWDVSDYDSCVAGIAKVEADLGPVDVLVNNAGLSQRTTALETSLASYRRLFEIDFFAPVALTRALLPAMAARGSGHVVVVSSVFGKIAMARRTGYAAAKHALHGYFDCARIELGDRGVRFTLACPGFVNTAISLNALGPEGRAWGTVDSDIGQGMTPAACADRIWHAVERDRYEVVIAGRERVAVWFKRFLPLRWYTAFARRLKVS